MTRDIDAGVEAHTQRLHDEAFGEPEEEPDEEAIEQAAIDRYEDQQEERDYDNRLR